MRSLAIFLVILLIIVGGAAIFLVATTPHDRAPAVISPEFIKEVPDSAEWFAIVPTAAALDAKLNANPVTRGVLEKWRSSQRLPRPWMLGNADLIAWQSGGAMHYYFRVDPLRSFVVRLFGHGDIITPPSEQPLDASPIIDLASKLPACDALVVQRENARGSFPPIARPAVTSVVVTRDEVRLTSLAHHREDGEDGASAPSVPSVVNDFPNGAVLSASFATTPRIIGDLNRVFGAKVSDLFKEGGMVCIYDVDFRKLLPRPLGVIVLPDDAQRRATISSLRDVVRNDSKDGMLLLSFDHSIDQYKTDVFEQPGTVGNEWTMRIDAPRLVPILNNFSQNLGARVLEPRLFRSARDLNGWIGGLEQAKVIDAAASVDSGEETLRVRITAK